MTNHIKSCLVALCLSLVAVSSVPALAETVDGDAHWSTEFWVRGFDGPITGAVEDGLGNMYVAGDFRSIDGVPFSRVAMWDGSSWSGLAAGLAGSPGDLAVDSQGRLIVVGGVLLDGEPGSSVVRWDGQKWTSLTLELDSSWASPDQVVVKPNDEIVITVKDVVAGGMLLAWDGSAWVELRRFGRSATGIAVAVAPDGSLYVADRTEVSGTGPGGPVSKNRRVDRLLVDGAGRLFAFVFQFDASRQYQLWIWDGSEWTVPLPDTTFRRLSLDQAGEVIAADGTKIERWNGTGWTTIGEPGSGGVERVVGYGDSLVAVGSLTKAGVPKVGGLARWQDGGWHAMHGSENGSGVVGSLAAIATDGNGDLFVGGTLMAGGETELSTGGYWDGVEWTPSNTASPIKKLVLTSDGILISESDGFNYWDGQMWQPMSPPLQGGRVDRLVADGLGGLIATGTFDFTPDGAEAFGIARWDGTSWAALGEGLSPAFSGDAVAADDKGNVFVAQGAFPYHLWHWDGSQWTDRGPAYQDAYSDLLFDGDGSLIAMGVAQLDPEIGLAPWLSKWDGESWVPIGPPDLARSAVPAQIRLNSCGELILLTDSELMKRGRTGAWAKLATVSGAIDFVQGRGGIYVRHGHRRDSRARLVAGGRPQSGVAKWTGPGLIPISDGQSVGQIVNACDYELAKHGDLLRLYQAFFGREPDAAGAKYWIDVNAHDNSLDQIADYFTGSQEFSNSYEGTTYREYLAAVYQNVLGREFDQEGFDYWLGLLESGELTRGGVVRWVAANHEFASRYPYAPTG